jgi:tetratricopeptide (TPR) repeat protein
LLSWIVNVQKEKKRVDFRMLIRSSSTPLLGSLISSISDSPNHHLHHNYQPEVQLYTGSKPPAPRRLSFHQSPSQNFTNISCNSSPISLTDFSGSSKKGFQRAQSEGNLVSLANDSSQVDEFSLSITRMKFARKPNCSSLQTIPSYSAYNTTSSNEDADSGDENQENQEFDYEKITMSLNEEMRYRNFGLENDSQNQQMRVSRGLGVTGVIDRSYTTTGDANVGYGGGGGGANVGYGGGGGDSGSSDGGNSLEEYYKKMVEENSGNPLFLRNYAQFLYQTKGDLERAEEYYSRAILTDSDDGEILSQYASLIWELHHDEDRALSYFERAVQVASQDSHVHAAYANFLWQIEDDDEEDEVLNPVFYTAAIASASA